MSNAQQSQDTMHYADLVEAYYNKAVDQPIFIYDAINGTIIDTLKRVDSKYSWYKIAIKESEYGWFKIKNIQRLPDLYQNFQYENYWVKNIDFLISVDNFGPSHRVYLYDEPSNNANKIHKIDSFQRVNVTEISDQWALVNFKIGKKYVSGWLRHEDQCALPWTTCPKY